MSAPGICFSRLMSSLRAESTLNAIKMLTNETNTTEFVSTVPSPAGNTNGSILPTDHTVIDKENQSLRFIIVPICALGIVVFLTIVVLLFLRKKRLDRLRHHLMPFYNFDPGEEGEDWEAELLEDSGEYNNIKGYKTMEDQFLNHRTLLSTD